jgi:glycosyltransferase involved in cell wall biosynthesis
VDNAPEGETTADAIHALGRPDLIERIVAPAPGLSFARNAAVAATRGETLAWIDDDEVADRQWLCGIARALLAHPRADVVSGPVAPAELETPAQVWFEQFGGHSKGRGFTPAVFSPASAATQSPLYPLPPFGAGANLATRPGVIESIGGFDTALGAGTPSLGGEDTLALTQVLLDGGTIVYQPPALVWHYHRRDLDGLRRQLTGYGTGLTAAYTGLVLRRPTVLPRLVRLIPTAVRDLTGRGGSRRTATIEADFPEALLGANLRGMVRGPGAYFAGRWRSRRVLASTRRPARH